MNKQLNYFYTFKQIKSFMCLVVLLVFVFGFTTCTKKQVTDDQVELPIIFQSNLITEWNDAFDDHKVLNFTFPDSETELLDIRGIEKNSKGHFFIQDSKAKVIVQFDPSGKFVRYIGRYGEGPGEFLIGVLSGIDAQDNVYVYDYMGKKFIQYGYPNYNYLDQVTILSPVKSRVVVTPDNHFISYSQDDTYHELISKFDFNGDVIKRAYRARDQKYTFFIKRFGLGRVNEYPGKGFLFVDPQRYKVLLFDYDLNIKVALIPEEKSKFFPIKKNFPNTLSPFEYSEKHSKWWEKSLVAYEAREINGFLITVINKYNKYSIKKNINIHDLKGRTYAIGLEIPFDGTLRLTKGPFIYIVEQDRLTDKGKIIAQKVHQYKICVPALN
jgi:hypothetical protein